MVQYDFFHTNNVLSKLEATLKSLKEKKEYPEIADLGFLSHFYIDSEICKHVDHMPVLIMQKEMKKTTIAFFKDGGFEVDNTILKSKQNKGDIFPNFDSIYESTTVLTLAINGTLIQAKFDSRELKSSEFMKNTYDSLDKEITTYYFDCLEQALPPKDSHTKKIKI